MSATCSAPAFAPDYVSIPEKFKAHPVDPSGLPRRLVNLLLYADIRCLGDLDGKRLSDFAGFRQCGSITLGALRRMIITALHPGVEPGPITWPIAIIDWEPPVARLKVPAGARGLRIEELLVSARLEHMLERLRIGKLGQLHGSPVGDLAGAPGFGPGMVAELMTLLDRARAGELAVPARQLASAEPSELPRLIDHLVNRLSQHRRTMLMLYMGGTSGRKQTLRQLGRRYHITHSAVGQTISLTLAWLRRKGGPPMQSLLRRLAAECFRTRSALDPAVITAWQDPARPFAFHPGFYVRLIPKLPAQRTQRPAR